MIKTLAKRFLSFYKSSIFANIFWNPPRNNDNEYLVNLKFQ